MYQPGNIVTYRMTFGRAFVLGLGVGLGLLAAWFLVIVAILIVAGAAIGSSS